MAVIVLNLAGLRTPLQATENFFEISASTCFHIATCVLCRSCIGVRYHGDGGYTVTNDEGAVTREFNASPVKSSLPTTQSGCDYISGFNHTSPSLSPIVRRGSCGESTKRPALCSISFPKLEVWAKLNNTQACINRRYFSIPVFNSYF